MKFLDHYKRLFIITLLSGVIMSPLLTSCGSSGEDIGIGGTGITQGKITGFGSIFVNGVEFDTNRSQFEVDGNTALNEGALKIGMVVRVTGKTDSDGLSGTADLVEYDDKLQGPVANVDTSVAGQITLTIFNKAIVVDDTSTKFDSTTFATIAMNDIVEISGFDTTTGINATYVRKTGEFPVDDEVELKGTITELKSASFKLDGITIKFGAQTEIEVPNGLSDGLFVEVEGVILPSLTEIEAMEIEAEDEDFGEGKEVSLQGVITEFTSISNFIIGSQQGSQQVNANGASVSPVTATLAVGVNVEVEGDIVNGVLIAEEVELREGEVEIKSKVFNVDLNNKQIEFEFQASNGTILVTTDNQTEFEDETGSLGTFSLSQIMPGNFIKIEGIDTGSQIIANQVKRLNPTGEDEEVQGSVENFIDIGSVSSITLFGVIFNVNNVTNPGFGIGDIVEIKDEAPIFGTIDEIELEN